MPARAAGPVATPRKPETLWKLVDAHCAQLAEATSGARSPFLLGLTWAFIWLWALYAVDFGHVRDQLRTYRELTVETGLGDTARFDRLCDQTIGAARHGGAPRDRLAAVKKEVCEPLLKDRLAWAEKTFIDSTLISFPGGFGKLSVSDLAVVGQVGLLLILSWGFFAARRVNHAVRALVDMDARTRRIGRWLPRKFVLEPQLDHLSAEHYAYAYKAVAQRFVFLFSQHSRPLLAYTVLLSLVPALVASWNIYTDVRDALGLVAGPIGLSPQLVVKTLIEAALIVSVWVVTRNTVRFEVDTSVLLNAWDIAVTDVWLGEWNETTEDKASRVAIDIEAQSGTVAPPAADGEAMAA